jgi:chaperonin GroES
MKIRPQNDYVLVEIDEEQTITEGGLAVPEDARIRPRWGIVLAVGPGRMSPKKRRWIDPDVKEGDRVCVPIKAGQDFKIGTRELKLLREIDIVAAG